MTETTEKSTKVSLRVMSSSLSARDVGAAIGLTPTKTFDKGDIIWKRGVPTAKTRGHSLWALDIGLTEDCPIEEHLRSLANLLSGRKDKIKALMSECEIDVFCAFGSANGQGTIIVPARDLQVFSELGIDIIVDVYLSELSG